MTSAEASYDLTQAELQQAYLEEEQQIDQELEEYEVAEQGLGMTRRSFNGLVGLTLGWIGASAIGLTGCKKQEKVDPVKACKKGKEVDLDVTQNPALEKALKPLIDSYNQRLDKPAGKAALNAAFTRLAPFHNEYAEILKKKCVPDELIAQLIVEWNLHPGVRSWAGAHGLAQIMPETATKDLGMHISNGLEVDDDSFPIMQVKRTRTSGGKKEMILGNYPERNYYDERDNPFSSVEAMGQYMSTLHRQFQDWHMAICAYNCGPGLMRKRLRLIKKRLKKKGIKRQPTMVDYVEYLKERILKRKCRATKENLGYIVKYIATEERLKQWRKDKLTEETQINVDSRKVEYQKTATYPHGREYTVKSGDCPGAIAQKLGVSLSELRKANPEISRRRGKIFPNQKLNVPALIEHSAPITPENIRQGINRLHPKDQISVTDFYGTYNPHAANPYRIYLENEVNEGQLDRTTKRIMRNAKRRKRMSATDYQKVVRFNLANQPAIPADYPIYLPEKYIPALETVLGELKTKKRT